MLLYAKGLYLYVFLGIYLVTFFACDNVAGTTGKAPKASNPASM